MPNAGACRRRRYVDLLWYFSFYNHQKPPRTRILTLPVDTVIGQPVTGDRHQAVHQQGIIVSMEVSLVFWYAIDSQKKIREPEDAG